MHVREQALVSLREKFALKSALGILRSPGTLKGATWGGYHGHIPYKLYLSYRHRFFVGSHFAVRSYQV